jgi:hypothetical protein
MFMLAGDAVAVRPGQDHAFHIDAHVVLLQQPELHVDLQRRIENHIQLHQRMMDRPAPDSHADVKWESPFGVRWPPDQFVVDPFAQDGIRDASFIAFQWTRPIDEVRFNPNYKNVENLEPSSSSARCAACRWKHYGR